MVIMVNKLKLQVLKKAVLLFVLGLAISCTEKRAEELSYSESDELISLPLKVSENNSVCNPNMGGPRDYTYPGPGVDVNKTTVNKTKFIDDRTCTYNYTQTTFGGRTYGVYKIKANSNHIDDLQPRIERQSKVINTTASGKFVRMAGYVTIKRAGHVSDSYDRGDMRDGSGTYIMQAKGKHTGGGGSPDPAICLLVAKPRFSGGSQVSYDIYREEITERGGSGVSGRRLVFLTNIPANTRRFVRMENGFTGSGSNKRHYVNVRIGGTDYNWDVPDPQRATQAKIRFGAYRCKGGEAEILWDGMSQTFND